MKLSKVDNEISNQAAYLFGLIGGATCTQVLYVSHKLNLFSIINTNSDLSLAKICNLLTIDERPCIALLSACVSLKLIEINNDLQYELTNLTKNFLLKDGKYYLGEFLDIWISENQLYSVDTLINAIKTNQPQINNNSDVFNKIKFDAKSAEQFTYAMHSKNLIIAEKFVNSIDLSRYNLFLDIGGGSGIYSIYAVKFFHNLSAIIYDLPIVCNVTEEIIRSNKLSDKIKICRGDIWHDPFPEADIHFYSDIFHDWPKKQCQFLLEKSFFSLKMGGKIIVHELLFNKNKNGPLSASIYNINMLLWTHGAQFTEEELVELIRNAGFSNIQAFQTNFGNWHIITATKL